MMVHANIFCHFPLRRGARGAGWSFSNNLDSRRCATHCLLCFAASCLVFLVSYVLHLACARDCIELLERKKEQQDKAKIYYAEHYVTNYVNDETQLNANGNGKIISLISVRENGDFISPRTMQHTSGVIHHQMNYPEFDFHSFRHTCHYVS